MDSNPYLSAYRQQQQTQQPVPVQQPQQQGGGGILGFLQGIGKSIGSDVGTVGNAFGSGINYLGGELSGQHAKQQQDILNNIRQAGQLRANAVGAPNAPQLEKQAAGLTNEANAGKAIQQSQFADVQQNNNPLKVGAAGGSLLLDAIGGEAGSGLLQGGLKQAIGQGIKQGAKFGAAQGALQPIKDTGTINPSDIGGNAVTGAATGAALGGAGGLAGGLLSKFIGKGKVVPETTPGATTPTSTNPVSTLLNDKGTQMQARAGGYGIGEQQGGKSLGFFDSAKMNQNLADEGIAPGAPSSRLKSVETALNQRGQQLDAAISSNNLPVSQADKHQIAADFMNRLDTTPGVTDAAKNIAEQHVSTLLKSGNDTKSLVNFKRGLDTNSINYNASPDAATSANQLASSVLRNTLKDAINTRVPEAQTLNNSYHNLSDAAGFLKGGAKKISDQSESAGGGVVGRLLTNETAQAAKSHAGNILQKVSGQPSPALPEATSPVATPTSPVSNTPESIPSPQTTATGAPGEISPAAVKAVSDQMPVIPGGMKSAMTAAKNILPIAQQKGILGAITTPTVARTAATVQPSQQEQVNVPGAQSSSQDTNNLDTSAVSSPSDTGSVFNQQNIENLALQDLQKNGGKNVASLMALYNAFGKPSAAETALTTNQKNEVVSQQKALDSLKVYTDRLAAAGGGSGPILGALQSSVLGNYIAPQAKALDSQRIDIASAIAGSLNPRGTVSPTTAKLIADALPTVSDSQGVAQAKIDGLIRQIQSGTFSADTSVPQLQKTALASQ